MRSSSLVLALALATLTPLAFTSAAPALLPSPSAVVALIDTGVNPYNLAFRDPSPLAFAHPCTYIPSYPCSAQALVLTLNAATYDDALRADQAVWDSVRGDILYWVPGTKIIGWIAMGSGGTSCDPLPPPVNIVVGENCREERFLLDDHGHGTMTASRAAATTHSLCGECRIVSIEGLGGAGVRWAADQGWIDVQSNSWLSLIPPPAGQTRIPPNLPCAQADPTDEACYFSNRGTSGAFDYAAKRMLTFAASGNGAAYLAGFAPTPTYVLSTAAPGVILVGGHDNGRAALWSGAPTTVVADAYGGWAAGFLSITQFGPDPISCCTSAASPYAAGGGAAIVVEARRLVGDLGVGVRGGFLAIGTAPPGVTTGPLSDGRLSLAEAAELITKTAQAYPQEGRDDGLVNFVSDPRPPTQADLLPFGPGGNPFCQGCIAAPLKWSTIPSDAPSGALAPHLGYGAINEFSVAKARRIMLAQEPMPDRSVEDAFFAADAAARQVFFIGTGT